MRHIHEEVHEECACTCCRQLHNLISFRDNCPFRELSYDCSLIVVSQSTHHYLSLVLTKRTHRVVETAKKCRVRTRGRLYTVLGT